MKFQISVIDDHSREHTLAEREAIDNLNDKMAASGYRVFAGGLELISNAQVFDYRDGAQAQSGGTLFSAQENYSGLWIIDVPSIEVARELAVETSKSCNRKVELRPFR